MGEVFLDAFLDSLKILAFLLVCRFVIALIEPKMSESVKLKGKLAPLIGVSVALLPQCGFAVVATDLYKKRHITVGTLIGVYLATSDEALPIFLAYPDKALHILPILALKFVLGVIIGYSIDLICTKNRKSVLHHLEHCDDEYRIRLTDCNGAEAVENPDCHHQEKEVCNCSECASSECGNMHKDCLMQSECHGEADAISESGHTDGAPSGEDVTQFKTQSDVNAEIKEKSLTEDEQKKAAKKQKIKRFLVNPLVDSLETFVYVLVINIVFGIIIYYVGEDKIIDFLMTNKYAAPVFSVLVGAIPNCASSIILSRLYIMGGLGFGATIGGLCMNAGLGFMVLLKNIKNTKSNLAIIGSMFVISIVIAYIFSAIFSFGVLPI